ACVKPHSVLQFVERVPPFLVEQSGPAVAEELTRMQINRLWRQIERGLIVCGAILEIRLFLRNLIAFEVYANDLLACLLQRDAEPILVIRIFRILPVDLAQKGESRARLAGKNPPFLERPVELRFPVVSSRRTPTLCDQHVVVGELVPARGEFQTLLAQV